MADLLFFSFPYINILLHYILYFILLYLILSLTIGLDWKSLFCISNTTICIWIFLCKLNSYKRSAGPWITIPKEFTKEKAFLHSKISDSFMLSLPSCGSFESNSPFFSPDLNVCICLTLLSLCLFSSRSDKENLWCQI